MKKTKQKEHRDNFLADFDWSFTFQTDSLHKHLLSPPSIHSHLRGTTQAGWTCIFLQKGDTTRHLSIWAKWGKETPSFPTHTGNWAMAFPPWHLCHHHYECYPRDWERSQDKAKHCKISQQLVNSIPRKSRDGEVLRGKHSHRLFIVTAP